MRKEVIGDAILYLGDCLEVLPEIEHVDAVITDPPYSSGGMVRGDRTNLSTRVKYRDSGELVSEHPEFSGDNRDQRGFGYWCALWLAQTMRATTPGGMLCVFTDWRQLPTTTDAIQAGGWVWRGIVPWNKRNSRPVANRFRSQCEYIVVGRNGPRSVKPTDGSVYHPGIFEITAPPTAERQHTTQKPVTLLEELCKVAPPGGVVLDPFMGSGTAGAAAINMGRQFIGVELQPQYFDIACQRIEQATKQQRLFA